MGQRTGNSTSSCDFLKFIISVRGSKCDCSLQATKKPSYATGGVLYSVLYEKLQLPFFKGTLHKPHKQQGLAACGSQAELWPPMAYGVFL
jgi:hypothetical protein